MSENNDNMELFAGGDEFETPGHAWRTLKRLWRSVSNQYKRLIIVLVSVIFIRCCLSSHLCTALIS